MDEEDIIELAKELKVKYYAKNGKVYDFRNKKEVDMCECEKTPK